MEARLSGIRETFSGEACEEVIALLELLCRRGRLAILEDCLKEYQELLRIFQNKAVAKVTSAVALTKEEQTRLQERLAQQSKQSVLLSCSVDPSLIGGIIVEMNGGVMDGSLRTCLEQVKEVVNQ